jgi:hypothetical protein
MPNLRARVFPGKIEITGKYLWLKFFAQDQTSGDTSRMLRAGNNDRRLTSLVKNPVDKPPLQS